MAYFSAEKLISMMLGIRVFDNEMYAVVQPKSDTIMTTATNVLQCLLPKASSAKSSYVFFPVKSTHFIYKKKTLKILIAKMKSTCQKIACVLTETCSKDEENSPQADTCLTNDIWHRNSSRAHCRCDQIKH